jgi:hypothetical protein
LRRSAEESVDCEKVLILKTKTVACKCAFFPALWFFLRQYPPHCTGRTTDPDKPGQSRLRPIRLLLRSRRQCPANTQMPGNLPGLSETRWPKALRAMPTALKANCIQDHVSGQGPANSGSFRLCHFPGRGWCVLWLTGNGVGTKGNNPDAVLYFDKITPGFAAGAVAIGQTFPVGS